VIDTHCHIDQFPSPELVAKKAERLRILTVAVTNLPSHYQMACHHLHGLRYVRPALGLHPLAAKSHKQELPLFLEMVGEAELIGEIGLDFSPAGSATGEIQMISFRAALRAMKGRTPFVTLHSRGAEDTVLDCLRDAHVGPVVFHWFSGTRATLDRIVREGHSLSFNPAMILSKRWNDWLRLVPRERVLTETDGPFTKVGTKPSEPPRVRNVLDWLAANWGCSLIEAERVVSENFSHISPHS
jgi:TatD DNase family protein